ncbi:MAG TPA: ATP-binding cassette domain-containing protein [Polyangia bacterium]|nr:ATP-binding cassette domain-containing protein [Polyangia bacterium]
MIRALELTKRYAGVTALDGVSFEARPGEVLGFLGPNGAGKTTTMRILTGYVAATRGRVEVCGVDFHADSRRARARIGYLPESVPLYSEMRVDEYLRYRAALKGVPSRARAARLDDVTQKVGIAGERRRVIGQLSKGYRQRVGLADALLHRPEVLILDEPTDGLDPNQRRDVLALVAELGRERTVILSTHILPEVESVCSRVVILDRGRIIAEGVPAELQRSHDLIVIARGAAQAIEAALAALEGVTRVEAAAEPDDVARFTVAATRDVREAAAEAVARAGGRLRELSPRARGLEEVFARLTRERAS